VSDALLYTPSGCVLYLDLRKPVGNKLLDYSGHGNIGTIYGARLEYRHPLWGLYFDGIDDYVSVPRSDSLNVASITLEALVKPYTFLSTENPILDRNNYYAFGFKDGKLWSWLRLPTQPRVGIAVEVGRWYHFVVTFADGVRNHYLNGNLVNSWSEDATEIELYDAVRMIIGANANDTDTEEKPPSYFFHGFISLVRVYNRALTSEEVKRCYEDVKLRLLRRMQPVGVKMIR